MISIHSLRIFMMLTALLCFAPLMSCGDRANSEKVIIYDYSSPLYFLEAPFDWSWIMSRERSAERYPWIYERVRSEYLLRLAERTFSVSLKEKFNIFKPSYIGRRGVGNADQTIFIGYASPEITGPMFFLALDEFSQKVLYAFSESDN